MRIIDSEMANKYIGKVCGYDTSDGYEYGRIKYATASGIVIERLIKTGEGTFKEHPVAICPKSKNQITFKRFIKLIESESSLDNPTGVFSDGFDDIDIDDDIDNISECISECTSECISEDPV
jgi:hypothetical protein